MKELQKKPVDRLKAILENEGVKKQFENAMGKHSDLFEASLIDAFSSGLQDCEPPSVISEALKAAILRLPISKSLGFAYLVPFKDNKTGKKNAQFQIGYKGLIQLALRSNQVKIINADIVYEGEFKGKNKITGEIDLTGEKKSDKIVGYFCYLELTNGFSKVEYWTKAEVLAHGKRYSKAFGFIWKSHEKEMCLKTVTRSVLSKYAPMSVEFLTAFSSEDEVEAPQSRETIVVNEFAPDQALQGEGGQASKENDGPEPADIPY